MDEGEGVYAPTPFQKTQKLLEKAEGVNKAKTGLLMLVTIAWGVAPTTFPPTPFSTTKVQFP